MIPTIKLIYEDEHMLAFDKPVGVVSVPAPHIEEFKTMQGWIREWAQKNNKNFKPYLLNRLDRDTSGIILFGKNPRDREKLENIFRDEQTQKTYFALVKGCPKPDEGTIKIPLEARTKDIKVPAQTHYKVIKKMGLASILEVKIDTGRKHQIRKHLSMIGHPLILDREYGNRQADNYYQKTVKGKGKFYLRAAKFEFMHPFLREFVKIEADL